MFYGMYVHLAPTIIIWLILPSHYTAAAQILDFWSMWSVPHFLVKLRTAAWHGHYNVNSGVFLQLRNRILEHFKSSLTGGFVLILHDANSSMTTHFLGNLLKGMFMCDISQSVSKNLNFLINGWLHLQRRRALIMIYYTAMLHNAAQ